MLEAWHTRLRPTTLAALTALTTRARTVVYGRNHDKHAWCAPNELPLCQVSVQRKAGNTETCCWCTPHCKAGRRTFLSSSASALAALMWAMSPALSGLNSIKSRCAGEGREGEGGNASGRATTVSALDLVVAVAVTVVGFFCQLGLADSQQRVGDVPSQVMLLWRCAYSILQHTQHTTPHTTTPPGSTTQHNAHHTTRTW